MGAWSRIATHLRRFVEAPRFVMSSSADSGRSNVFQGIPDRFNGIRVDSSKESCNDDNFDGKLTASLAAWQDQKVRGVWFKVTLQHSHWVPLLAKHQFQFHHAYPEHVTMVRWLSSEACNIPSYAHTMLSVGGLVTDSRGQLLTIKEKVTMFSNWKLPGGYVESREDIGAAAVREVFEETGIRTKFHSLIGFLHSHTSQFGCSDMYLIVHLTPESEDQPIKKCEREIAECCWMKIDEFLSHPEVHKMNRMLVRKFLENKASGVSMPAMQVPHPLLPDNKVTIFNLSSTPSSSL